MSEIILRLAEQLRAAQDVYLTVRLDEAATPRDIDKVNRAVVRAEHALLEAVTEDLKDSEPAVLALSTKIQENNAKIKAELAGLQNVTALLVLTAEVVKLSVEVARIAA